MNILPSPSVSACRVRAALAAALGLLACATPSRAFQFAYGELKGSFDSTSPPAPSTASKIRAPSTTARPIRSTPSPASRPPSTPTTATSNYEKGWVSELLKGSHDLELRYRNFAAFARGYYFRDLKAEDTARTDLGYQAKDRVVSGYEMLDAYVVAKLEAGGIPVDLRLGRQVLSLGESTFIPNGINVRKPRRTLQTPRPRRRTERGFPPRQYAEGLHRRYQGPHHRTVLAPRVPPQRARTRRHLFLDQRFCQPRRSKRVPRLRLTRRHRHARRHPA